VSLAEPDLTPPAELVAPTDFAPARDFAPGRDFAPARDFVGAAEAERVSFVRPALIAAVAVVLLFTASSLTRGAIAASGGYSPREAAPVETAPPAEAPPTGLPAPVPVPVAPAGPLATLAGERAIAPAAAPPAVKRVIAAANRIRATPYVWGGGHARWWDKGYDCSGSVSYVLHGGGLLEAPLVSGSFATWGEPGPGRWITIYANKQHVYAVIAGLRWDTGGDPTGVTGPRWHTEPPYPAGFVVRHPVGY
jgi:cell wall-associated NlpC family hydrolase